MNVTEDVIMKEFVVDAEVYYVIFTKNGNFCYIHAGPFIGDDSSSDLSDMCDRLNEQSRSRRYIIAKERKSLVLEDYYNVLED